MEQRMLGDYQLIKSLGQGALGTVYLAEHRFMKRQFAIKILPEDLASNRTFIQRFEENIGVLSELEHPNIVKVYNISYSDGKYFIVMDCVVDEVGETTNLAQYVVRKGDQLKEEQIIELLRQIADALDYAHSKRSHEGGIVHSNLKPNNILIGWKDGQPNVALTDFGLTKIIGSGNLLTRTYKNVADSLQLTQQTEMQKGGENLEPSRLSTLHTSFLQNYATLAPEQKRLESSVLVSAKADAYAFGIIAYFLLMKHYPEGLFPLPSETQPHLRADWDRLIRSCLKLDLEQRPELLLPLLKQIQQEKQVPSQGNAPHPKAEEVLTKPKKVEVAQPVEAIVGQAAGTVLRPVFHTPKLQRPQTDLDPAAALHVDSTVTKYNPENKEYQNLDPIQSEMVIVQGGTFLRGSNEGNRDEMPLHKVLINNFAIDIHPVTNEQFLRFLEVMGGEKDRNHQDIIQLRDSRIKRSRGKLLIESGYAKHPVVGVTWYGAFAYAEWVGKRLPYEVEWEIAACGGDHQFLFPTGDTIEKTQANFFSSDTTAVMSYPPNVLGIHDLAGNVYEWCQDWYGYNYYEVSAQEPDNPRGPLQGVYRVLRGGCWKSLKEDLRCSRRHRNNPGTVNSTYGFRCVADVQEGRSE